MADDKKSLTLSIIAILLAIGAPLSIDGIQDAFNNELQDYYRCSIDGDIKPFPGGISKTTGYSGYPFEDSRKGPVYCGDSDNKGKWVSLIEYAEELGIDPYVILSEYQSNNPPVIGIDVSGTKYVCKSGGYCRRI